MLCHQHFFCSHWQSSHTSYRTYTNSEDTIQYSSYNEDYTSQHKTKQNYNYNYNYNEDYSLQYSYIDDFNPMPQEFTCLLLTSCEPRSTSDAYPTITNSGDRTCLPDPFKRQKCGGCSCEQPWCHGRCYFNSACFFAACSSSPYREDSGKTCSLQVFKVIENEDSCKESCTVSINQQANCQSCIEEELKSLNLNQCLDLSGAECFHCTKSIMIESIECSKSNTNPEDIVNCIQQEQHQDCKQCTCTILCYVSAEGDLCQECLQNSNLATFFLNHDKCPQSWTWSMEQTKCFKAFTTSKPWSFASTFCQNGGGLLAQSKTYSSLFTVLEAISLEAASGEFWIGGRHMLGSGIGGWPGDYTWTEDNSTLDNSNWAPGYPTHPIFSGSTASDVTYIWSPNYPQDYFNSYEQVRIFRMLRSGSLNLQHNVLGVGTTVYGWTTYNLNI